MHQCQGKKVRRGKKRKGIEAHRVKHPTPSQAADSHTGDEKQNGKQENKKKETGNGSPTQLPWAIESPTTRRDHTVSLFSLPPSPGPLGRGYYYYYIYIYFFYYGLISICDPMINTLILSYHRGGLRNFVGGNFFLRHTTDGTIGHS